MMKLRCEDYGFECNFIVEGTKNNGIIEKLRSHFEEEHGIEYTTEVITQMIINRGYSFDSIRKE